MWLDRTPCREACREDAELVLSELVTNALTHGRSAPLLRVVIAEEHLRIEVHDDQPTPPEVSPSQGPRGGFGLYIVGAVALDWGWYRTPGGKAVWADIRLG